ncbi:MAG: helix-hairpin-helix domain-containing protein, partial [Planctomycetota bacterium]|nr:helix-hairpin-helix domain-containing protein [Planctomycetota bacterium]
FKDYHNFQTPLNKIPHYRVLAINRGERASKLKVKIKVDDEKLNGLASEKIIPADHPNADFMKTCLRDAINRLIMPSLEREIRRELTDRAERQAVTVFAHNLKNLLLQAPVQNQKILAIDPGYKRGCSVVAMDSCGKVLASDHIFVVGNQERKAASAEKITELVKQHAIDLIAIGNGAACREAEQLVSDVIANHFAEQNLKYAMVNEAGASFYSTSEIGREELPDVSPAVRSAISIGRRLMDPLSELVKISPANIGVGMYQHDVKAKHLSDSLDEVVTFCVNRVGVNVNTASPSLLRYVSGLNQLTARRVFEYREENGPFKNRAELRQVTGFGDATFIQSAGFLRIRDGDQPLDSTAIHPESYPLAETLIQKVNANLAELFPKPKETSQIPATDTVEETPPSVSDGPQDTATEGESVPEVSGVVNKGDASPTPTAESLVETTAPEETSELAKESESAGDDSAEQASATVTAKIASQSTGPRLSNEELERRKEITRNLRELDAEKLATENQVGKMLVKDILQVLCRPGYDPRNKINRPVFRKGILKFDELKPELQFDAQVVNVVDFGVFVDIGLGTSCLVHVSQLANRYIKDPHEDFAVGDVLQVWVTEVDATQRRVKLTAIRPGSKRKPGGKRGPKRGGPSAAKGQGSSRPRSTHRHQRQAGGKPRFKKSHEKSRRRPPKPVKPITDEMLSGNAPMRSFSDLSQFYDKKSETSPSKDSEDKNE